MRSYVTNDTHAGTASVIDERFEQVLAEYSDDDIGSISDDDTARGQRTLDDFKDLLGKETFMHPILQRQGPGVDAVAHMPKYRQQIEVDRERKAAAAAAGPAAAVAAAVTAPAATVSASAELDDLEAPDAEEVRLAFVSLSAARFG